MRTTGALRLQQRPLFLSVRYDKGLLKIRNLAARIDSPVPRKPISWPQVYLAVALTTLATLVLELSLTRIFSVIFYYHFAFLAVSIALFGLGAGGVLSYALSSWQGKVFPKLGWLSTLNGVAVPLALIFLLTRGKELSNWQLAAVYFSCALPFLIAGIVVSSAIAETIQRVDRVYFFDLLGAGLGCLVLVPFLNLLGGPNTVIASGVLFTTAGAVWFHLAGRIQGRAASVLLALALTSLVILNFKDPVVEVKYAKGKQLEPELFTKWNSFSRIGVTPSNHWIVIDADASTGISTVDLDHLSPQGREDLLTSGPALPYRIKAAAKTLILGAGGGYDVARAIASGSKDVTAVEINPIIANQIMRDRFREMSHNLYFRPEVRLVVEDGRAFVRRTSEKYQILQATLVDTWAATAAGAFALTENNLYTTDAFYDYLSHLTDDGMLAFTRWGFEPPRESLRLLSLARVALLKLGETDPARHFVVARENANLIDQWGATDTVIVTRKPIAKQALGAIQEAIRKAKLEAVYLPGDPASSSAFARLLTSHNLERFYRDYPYDVRPVSDNRPFFFYTVQPRDVQRFLTQASPGSADYKINRAVPLLFGLLAVSLLATLVTLALPPLILKARLPAEPGLRRFLLYFVAIGVGYILIQVALIQKFVLFLGKPTYALTVIIFSMLISSGVGSFFCRRLLGDSRPRWSLLLILVAAGVSGLAVLAGPITSSGVGWPGWVKVLLAIALIAPVGFAMGMPFPRGLSYLERRHKPSVRWAWSLNAASSVLGSACSIFFALYFGLVQTLIIGGLLYAGAAAIVRAERA
ncbi:MAG: hypothetical protein NZV14_10915 [Bryobacteraceae bacterium]|nr:hypothetical protein [Bryobacteraceae bacterium]MDW8378664.1 hypothetical protein [Bryobacterales bacterium]